MNSRQLACPSAAQIAWQEMELGMFIYFGMSTYAFPGDWGRGWRTCAEVPSPDLFCPERLDTDQWLEAAVAMGAKYAVLVPKHCDGFCLWPTDAYPYSVKQSRWRNGKGDVVADFIASCRKYGVRPGIYASVSANAFFKVDSPGLVNSGKGGDPVAQARYARACEQMLTELWTRYGALTEIWFDGGVLPPEQGGPDVVPLLERYQPQAVVFGAPAAYPTQSWIRWIGNEDGVAPDPCWSSMSPGQATAQGDPDGAVWAPAECDVPIRHANQWRWQPGEEHLVMSLDHLMGLYYRSVGHNCNFLLNATPDVTGLIPEPDFSRYAEFGKEIRRRFGAAVAETAGEGEVLELRLAQPALVDHVVLMEDIRHGHRVRAYAVEAEVDGAWRTVCEGTVIGHKKIDRLVPSLKPVSRLRFVCRQSRGVPILRHFGVYYCARTEAEEALASLELFLKEYACYERMQKRLDRRTAPEAVQSKLLWIERALLPRLGESRKRTSALIAADPNGGTSRRLKQSLTRIEEVFGEETEALAASLSLAERTLRAAHGLSLPLTQFEASALYSPVSAIQEVALPPAEAAFTPVPCETDHFVDLRSVHGGRDGLLYLRTVFQTTRPGPGRFLCGPDGPFKVWINGREAGCEPQAGNPAIRGQYVYHAVWEDGANDVGFAIATNHGNAWGLFAEVVELSGLAPGQ